MTAGRVIAIDGAAGSGKSTLARNLARAVHLPYVNTGLMYRALTASAIRHGVSGDDVEGLLDLTRGLRFTLGDSDPHELKVEGRGRVVLQERIYLGDRATRTMLIPRP